MRQEPPLNKTHLGVWFLWATVLTVILVGMGTANLDNYPAVGGDESWEMSKSHKLVTEGVFGSAMFAGFFNADRHYLTDLPIRNVGQVLSFQVFGFGIAQLRLPSVLSGLILLWIVLWLAFQWYGLPTSILTGIFLVLWRSELTAAAPGIPLLAASRSARPDVAAVMWSWMAIGLINRLLRHPNRIVALCLGVCCGLAALTHVHGAFVLPLIALVWFWQRGRSALVDPLSYLIVSGFALVCLPFVLYVVLNWPDFQGQWFVHAGRTQFGSISFYVNNLLSEARRFDHLLDLPIFRIPGYQPLGPWIFWIGILPAVICVWYRALRKGQIGDRLLATSLLVSGGLLALTEQTKAPLYAIELLPAICMALALFTSRLLEWIAKLKGKHLLRVAFAGVLVMLLLLTVAEASATYWIDRQRAYQITDYLDIGRRLESNIPAEAGVAGVERWWWALHGQPYLSLSNLWLQWQIAARDGDQPPEFATIVEQNGTEFVIVDPVARAYIGKKPDLLESQFWDLLTRCGIRLDSWAETYYGHLEIYQIAPGLCN